MCVGVRVCVCACVYVSVGRLSPRRIGVIEQVDQMLASCGATANVSSRTGSIAMSAQRCVCVRVCSCLSGCMHVPLCACVNVSSRSGSVAMSAQRRASLCVVCVCVCGVCVCGCVRVYPADDPQHTSFRYSFVAPSSSSSSRQHHQPEVGVLFIFVPLSFSIHRTVHNAAQYSSFSLLFPSSFSHNYSLNKTLHCVLT
jgi:hypothetical protein